MADYLIKGKSLSDIANATRRITESNEGLTLEGITRKIDETSAEIAGQADLIAQIASALKGKAAGGGSSDSVSSEHVNFYDYDGTLLHSYSVEKFQSMTEMPPLPSHDGLICQGWNWDIETIKEHNRSVNVGAMYITDDGKTRIYIHLEEGRTSPMLRCCPDGTVTIDWGDGSNVDILTGTSTSGVKYTSAHKYASPGDYVITLTVEGYMGFTGITGSDSYGGLLRFSSSLDNRNYAYLNATRKIELGENITRIGEYAFSQCGSLSSITIPKGITNIGNYIFNNCYSLSSIIIPKDITKITSYAFNKCYSLSNISIPNSITSINNYAFGYCYSLSNISLPDSVTSINNYAFAYCSSLSNIIIPDSVTSIGSYAFEYCYSLSNVIIPNSVTSIGSYTFAYCYSLSNIVIPDSVTSLNSYAFSACSSLTNIIISNNITSIGNGTFSSCYPLSNIIIPDSVTSIGSNTFSYCYSLFSITLESSTPPTLASTTAFTNIPNDCIIYVPVGSLADYQAATNWSTYADRMQEYSV